MKQDDLAEGIGKEEELCKRWCKARSCSYIKAPTYEDFDFFITKDGMLDHFLEVRTRNVALKDYQDTMIPLRKYNFAMNMLRANYKVYALIEWTDKIGFLELWQRPDAIQLITRKDRNETNPYAMFKISKINIL